MAKQRGNRRERRSGVFSTLDSGMGFLEGRGRVEGLEKIIFVPSRSLTACPLESRALSSKSPPTQPTLHYRNFHVYLERRRFKAFFLSSLCPDTYLALFCHRWVDRQLDQHISSTTNARYASATEAR